MSGTSAKVDRRPPALVYGNQVRLERARVRRELKQRKLRFSDALESPAVRTMPVIELLAFLPGKSREVVTHRSPHRADLQAAKIALAASITSAAVRVGDLDEARRARLIAQVKETVPGMRAKRGGSR